MQTVAHSSWHELPVSKVAELLETDLVSGLSAAEVESRLKRYGPNKVTEKPGTRAWKRFLLQFHQPLIYILLVASGVTLALGEVVDGSVIFGVVFVLGVIGYIQETKAEDAIRALTKMLVTEATVRRDGRKQRVRSIELVPGDVVLLQSGDRVPADLRLVRLRSLEIDESMLTGESLPVRKHVNPLALETVLADRKNLAFAGTLVTRGEANGVVCATGDQTETGRIARLISEAVDLSTPLTRRVAQFSRILLWLILGLRCVRVRRRRVAWRKHRRDVRGCRGIGSRCDSGGIACCRNYCYLPSVWDVWLGAARSFANCQLWRHSAARLSFVRTKLERSLKIR